MKVWKTHAQRGLKVLLVMVCVTSACAVRVGSFEEFFIAVRNDNVAVLQQLLARGFDPNTADEQGQPGLLVAMREDAMKVARVLIVHPELQINALNRSGESALMIAAIKGNLDAAKRLVAQGAQVNAPGWSPLHYAAAGPEPEIVRWLTSRGAQIDAVSPNGTTPLMMAAQYGSPDNVDVLLEKGADTAVKNGLGLRAADFALRAGRDRLALRLNVDSVPAQR
jgi:uncharacterized protein